MLRSLEIRNYRNLRHLTIEKLGRVNLLVGKNNTGKTSVLEAISIHINKGDLSVLLQLIDSRGENYIYVREYSRGQEARAINRGHPDETDALKTFNALFTDRDTFGNKLTIRSISQIPFLKGELDDIWHETSFQIVKQPDSVDEELIKLGKLNIIPRSDLDDNVPVSLLIAYDDKQNIVPVSHNRLSRAYTSMLFENFGKNANYQFIRTNSIEEEKVVELWDRSALTWRENEVINALKIIDNRIERISFISGNRPGRVAVVKLSTSEDIVPLRSMGDGVNRILAIILAMLDCHFGYLLIDEFENGLHYSVQEKLWEIIFYLSERLNIQVFATTHSNDTIRSFTSVLAKQENPDELGKAIRLQLHNDAIRAVDYSPEELETAVEYNIEVR